LTKGKSLYGKISLLGLLQPNSQLTKPAAETIAIEVLSYLARIRCGLTVFWLCPALAWRICGRGGGTRIFGRDSRPSRLRRAAAARLSAHAGQHPEAIAKARESCRLHLKRHDYGGSLKVSRPFRQRLGSGLLTCVRKPELSNRSLHGLATASTPKTRTRAGASRTRTRRHGYEKNSILPRVCGATASGLGRRLVRENTLSVDDLIWPIFICEGKTRENQLPPCPASSASPSTWRYAPRPRRRSSAFRRLRCFLYRPEPAERAGQRGAQSRKSHLPRVPRDQARSANLGLVTDVALDPYTIMAMTGFCAASGF